MKIIILTLQLDSNYGGILQCYALQTVLENMGHKVRVLCKPRYGLKYYIYLPILLVKNLYRRYFRNEYVRLFEIPYYYAHENIDLFIKKYIHRYVNRKFNSYTINKFDAIIVGSDQVWRPAYSHPIEEAFLSFLKDSNIKRIAYAASFGKDNCDEFTQEQLKTCSKLLQKFDAVSVRESSGIDLCKKLFNVEAVRMLDPTLLLTADDYRDLIRKGETKPSKGNMLVYILDKSDEKKVIVNQIAIEKGLIPFWLDSPDENNANNPQDKRVKISIEQWLRSFDDAEFVLTDSFHGCVFSIIFKKQFLAIGNKKRGLSRFISLLEQFSLSDRLLLDIHCYDKNKLNNKIDFNNIDDLLNEKRKFSFDFIKSFGK